MPAHERDELRRIALRLVGRGVDVDALILRRQRDHLVGPGIADVPADDRQLREVEGHAVEIGNRPPRLRGLQRPRVPHLKAEGNAQLHALRVERVVAPVIRRQLPQPRQHPQPHEAKLLHRAAKLAHRLHRLRQVHRRHPEEAVGMGRHEGRHLIVVDQRPLRPPPSRHQRLRHPSSVERPHRQPQRDRRRNLRHPHPPPERREHLVPHEPRRRMLNPRIDDRRIAHLAKLTPTKSETPTSAKEMGVASLVLRASRS